ncbi:MAG: ABC transporter permease [Candidatus Bipolaricaulota bacterium]|nr:ABC transporter permease [Candidatus Bipolaricaulota bacterium]MDW8127244.1 ABC transporter permease [Candidatus Bipolaricaulota bacterium]
MTRLFLGLVCLLPGLVLVVVGAFWLPFSPTAVVDKPFLSPSLSHPFGTDWFGRDLLARVMVGGRASWTVTSVSVAVAGVLGVFLGLVAGYFRGPLGEVLVRLADGILAFPSILLALIIAAVLGRGVLGVTLALTIFNLPYFLRLAHAKALELREQEFVIAAKAAGANALRVLLFHILPNLASPLLVQTTFALGTSLLAEASLSYLGLGVQPPQPTWGRMLWEAQSWLAQSPWPAIFPGLVMALAILGLNLLGDFLRDLLDPHLRPILSPFRLRRAEERKAG